jgi:hypothetical protein
MSDLVEIYIFNILNGETSNKVQIHKGKKNRWETAMSLAEVIKAKITTRQTFHQISTSRNRQLGWHPKINSG